MAISMSPALSNTLSSQLSSTQLEQISKHPNDPATLQIMHEAANALQAAKNFTAAKELSNLTWQRQKAILDPQDPATLSSLYCRGLAEVNLGQFASAEQTYRHMKLLYENMPQKQTSASSATWHTSSTTSKNTPRPKQSLGIYIASYIGAAGGRFRAGVGEYQDYGAGVGGTGEISGGEGGFSIGDLSCWRM